VQVSVEQEDGYAEAMDRVWGQGRKMSGKEMEIVYSTN